MSAAQELRNVVGYLNVEGGFSNSLNYERIARAAGGLPWSVVEKVINSCKAEKDYILDHTFFVCSELDKLPRNGLVGEAGAILPSVPEGDGNVSEQDDELWNRIHWMNTEGGFENAIRYDDVVSSARGLDTAAVVLVLTHLEDKWQEVNDPTSWVCAALHKKRNGKGGGKGPSGKGAEPEQGGQPVVDASVRERVAWLNGEGGFQDSLKYDQVAAKASGLDAALVLKILGHLEDKKGEVNDPTSWVCAALIKEQRSREWSGGSWGHGGGAGAPRQPPAVYGSQPDGGAGQSVDRELRRRIAWLNNEGGFGNTITYRDVADAASGLELSAVARIFDVMQESRKHIANPTDWLTNALPPVQKTIAKR